MSAIRPMFLKPFTQANRHTKKKGANDMTEGTFSYMTKSTKFFCSIMGSSAAARKKRANSA